MNCNKITNGLKVKIIKLESIKGFLIKEKHLNCRRIGVTGTVDGWVPGHGGDVWWVKHEGNNEVGAYCFTEFEPINE